MSKHIFVVFTNALPGQDREFNEWYTDRHIPDALRLPGIVAAQRFTLSDIQRMNAPYKYLAIYEIQTNDLSMTMQTLGQRIGTSEMPLSNSLDPVRSSWIYHPITARLSAGDI